MSSRGAFRLNGVEVLERRVTLSHGMAGSAGHLHALDRHTRITFTQQISSQINADFDSFTNDYLQALGTYLSISPMPAEPDKTALTSFTQQRVDVLAQELTRQLARIPSNLARPNGKPIVLQTFIANHIISASDSTNVEILNNALIKDAPPGGMVTSKAATGLYIDAAINAIEAARTATLNGVVFSRNNVFNNGRFDQGHKITFHQ